MLSPMLHSMLETRYDLTHIRSPRLLTDLIVPFTCCVRLTEVLLDLAQASDGEPWDAGYTLHNLRSLENLSALGERRL